MPKEGGEQLGGLRELETFARLVRRVTVYTFDRETDEPKAHELRIAPMTFDVCCACAAHLRPIVEKIGPEIRLDDLPRITAENGPDVRAIVAAASESSDEFIGSLPVDQFGILAEAVWKVNLDFFVLHVGPVFKRLARALFSGDGPTSSTSSPSTDTTRSG